MRMLLWLITKEHWWVINDPLENDFIEANITNMCFIGLNDATVEDSLGWSSGAPVDYLNLNGDGNNSFNNDYAVIQEWDGFWQLVNPFVYKNFVMELDCTPASSVTLNQIGGPSNGALLSAGTYTITYEAVDGCGDIEFCSFEITVQENAQTTMIDCPENVTVYETQGSGGANVVFAPATGTTFCGNGGLQIQQVGGQPSGSFFNVGSHIIAYEASDNCGSISTCSFLVNVLPLPAAVSPVPFHEFVGANSRVQDPKNRFACYRCN